ncbi:MAG TPA: Mur ligase domain-containing protein [Candidatus Paceibacterota bacterium]|nr:Mur ligase domain-containing protein [Candidatus Paceibacterota bacterium]
MDHTESIVHFIGIGGIGMSALAQLLHKEGSHVSGSDRNESPITELLEQKDIAVTIPQRAENVSPDTDLVVYSDAVPADNPERIRARELGLPEYSYFEMLGKVSKGKKTVAIAGTHGKTTTTGMLALILRDAGAEPTAIIGSIVKDFGSNYVSGTSDLFVVEACEYRNHLLELSPEILVINNLEWDHTDYFPSLEVLQETFRKAILRVPHGGVIVTNPNDAAIAPLLAGAAARIVDYTEEGAYQLSFPGEFNQNNARAAVAAARAVDPAIPEATITSALKNFQGTWRRFEYKGTTAHGAEVYDDYAHHPTAIRLTLEALRRNVPGTLYVVFHPHLYSRTHDLLEEFSTAFAEADVVLLAPIYAAREVDDGSISSDILAQRVRATGIAATAYDSFDAIRQALSPATKGDTIITMGAGDIYKVADALVKQSVSPSSPQS